MPAPMLESVAWRRWLARPAAVVHAFEPTPEVAAQLRETARLNGLDRLIVHDVAVSSHGGHAILRRLCGETGSNEGMNFICADTGESGAERVTTVCLDDFCRERDNACVDLLKLDVQGHEHSVLQGAEGLIRLGRLRTIFMELNWAGNVWADCSATKSVRLLAQAGYLFSNPVDWWRSAGPWLQRLSDVIARRFEET